MPDSAVPIEELLVHLDWVRALAFRLVGRDAESDDIVQRTFESALRSPPRESRAIKGWLRRVVTNAVAEMRRSELRREHREAAAGVPEASAPDVSEIAARVEMQRLVVAAVQELPEHYRETIHLRYFGGLSRQQMAAELGVTEEAVKSRLARAIDLLRADLKKRLGVDDAGLELALLPLLTWPWAGAVPASAPKARPGRRRAARRAAVAAALTLALVTGLAGSYRALTAPGASAGVAGRAGSEAGRPEAGPPPRRAGAPSASVEPGVPDEVPAHDERTDSSNLLGEATELLGRVARVRLRGWNEELGDVRLRVVTRHVNAALDPPEHIVIARGGVAILDAATLSLPDHTAVLYHIVVDHPELVATSLDVPANLHPTRATDSQLDLMRATLVRGTVTGPGGVVPQGARVAVLRRLLESERCDEVDSCEVAPDGRFELRAKPGQAGYVIAAARGLQLDYAHFNDPEELSGSPIVLRLTEGATLSGQVLYDVEGPKCESVSLRTVGVAWGMSVGDIPISWRDGRFEPTSQSAAIGSDGWFEVVGVSPAIDGVAPAIVGVSASGQAVACGRLPEFAKRCAVSGASLEFRIPGVPILVQFSEAGRALVGVRVSVSGPNGVGSGYTDDDGSIAFRVEPDVEYKASVWGRRPVYTHRFTPHSYSGRPEVFAIDVPKESLFEWRVRLMAPDGQSVQRATATFRGRGAGDPLIQSVISTYDAAAGALVFGGVPKGDYVVEIGAGEAVHDPTVYLEIAVAEVSLPAPDGHVHEYPLRGGGRLVLRVCDPRGDIGSFESARLVSETAGSIELRVAPRGGGDVANVALSGSGYVDTYPVVPPGDYHLVIVRAHGQIAMPVHIDSGDSTVVDVELPD